MCSGLTRECERPAETTGPLAFLWREVTVRRNTSSSPGPASTWPPRLRRPALSAAPSPTRPRCPPRSRTSSSRRRTTSAPRRSPARPGTVLPARSWTSPSPRSRGHPVQHLGLRRLDQTRHVGLARRSRYRGQVVDVTISPVAGATQYNIWGSNSGATTYYLLATCGGTKYTLQRHPAGVRHPARATRLRHRRGHPHGGRYPDAVRHLGVGRGVPDHAVQLAGRVHQQRCRPAPQLQHDLHGAEGAVGLVAINPGAFKADPAEIVSSGSDIANLSQDVI